MRVIAVLDSFFIYSLEYVLIKDWIKNFFLNYLEEPNHLIKNYIHSNSGLESLKAHYEDYNRALSTGSIIIPSFANPNDYKLLLARAKINIVSLLYEVLIKHSQQEYESLYREIAGKYFLFIPYGYLTKDGQQNQIDFFYYDLSSCHEIACWMAIMDGQFEKVNPYISYISENKEKSIQRLLLRFYFPESDIKEGELALLPAYNKSLKYLRQAPTFLAAILYGLRKSQKPNEAIEGFKSLITSMSEGNLSNDERITFLGYLGSVLSGIKPEIGMREEIKVFFHGIILENLYALQSYLSSQEEPWPYSLTKIFDNLLTYGINKRDYDLLSVLLWVASRPLSTFRPSNYFFNKNNLATQFFPGYACLLPATKVTQVRIMHLLFSHSIDISYYQKVNNSLLFSLLSDPYYWKESELIEQVLLSRQNNKSQLISELPGLLKMVLIQEEVDIPSINNMITILIKFSLPEQDKEEKIINFIDSLHSLPHLTTELIRNELTKEFEITFNSLSKKRK